MLFADFNLRLTLVGFALCPTDFSRNERTAGFKHEAKLIGRPLLRRQWSVSIDDGYFLGVAPFAKRTKIREQNLSEWVLRRKRAFA